MNKELTNMFKNMQAFSFLVGMAFGAAIGLSLFCYLVPHGPRAIAMLQHYEFIIHGGREKELKNKNDFVELNSQNTSAMSGMNHMDHKGMTQENNPYMMSAVTSEGQFLKDMTLHHEAAVTMAQQVLKLPSLHQETKNLANAILKTQTKEITDMKAWVKAWGY